MAIVLMACSLPSFADKPAPKLDDVSTGIDASAIDPSIDPCTDFYQYSCGNWIKRFTLPADQSRWVRSFTEISEENAVTLREILEGYAKNSKSSRDPNAKKLGDYFAGCMDESSIESNSKSELALELKTLDGLRSKADLPEVVAKLHLKSNHAFFSFGRDYDLKHPKEAWIAEISQGGFSLPDTDYYRSSDAHMKEVRDAFTAYIAKTFVLLGDAPDAVAKEAKAVFSIEERLAKSGLAPENLQDATTLYHLKDQAFLEKTVPSFNWKTYFKALGLKSQRIINVTEEPFLKEVEKVIAETELGEIKDYLRFRIANDSFAFLGQSFYDPWFDFNKKTLMGQKEKRPRWKECVHQVSELMDEALGRPFVEKLFSQKAKVRAKEMIGYLRKAFEQDLKELAWLDEPTRLAALQKLNQFDQKIGYPDRWKDYSKLKISRKSPLANAVAATELEQVRQLKTIGQPVDLKEWGMPPQAVNAYYDPSLNQINFPAAILQPPFFSEKFSDALNYGAIGMVIGHEMSHGFDTSGSKFDGAGVMNDWWSQQVKTSFEKKASCMIDQYSTFDALPGLKVNGKLTITENIADNGGLKLAYIAFKLANQGKPPIPEVAGLNADQQFFVSNAQSWCTKASDAAIRAQVSGNPHSPSKSRIIGPMMNNRDFAKAFKCESGKPMAPKNGCYIW